MLSVCLSNNKRFGAKKFGGLTPHLNLKSDCRIILVFVTDRDEDLLSKETKAIVEQLNNDGEGTIVGQGLAVVLSVAKRFARTVWGQPLWVQRGPRRRKHTHR
jgi:hypothetical protein